MFQQQQQPVYQFGQQQQQQMGQQFQQQNFAEYQKKQNQQAQMLHVKSVLTRVYNLQNQPQLQNLIKLLTSQQNLANAQMQKNMDQTDIKTVNQTQIQELYRRGKRIRQRNSIILSKLLVIKAKLERYMYQHANPHSRYENETQQAMDKIRSIKSEIMQKFTYLKTLRFDNSNENGERRNISKQSPLSNIGTSLTELKNGTQILEREVLRQKIDMEVFEKFIHESN